jgi:hypothetical protein
MPELSPDCHFELDLEYQERAGPEGVLPGLIILFAIGKVPSFSLYFSLARIGFFVLTAARSGLRSDRSARRFGSRSIFTDQSFDEVSTCITGSDKPQHQFLVDRSL